MFQQIDTLVISQKIRNKILTEVHNILMLHTFSHILQLHVLDFKLQPMPCGYVIMLSFGS
jgi:hypothetical protein